MKQTRREFVRTLFVATQAVAISQFLPGTLQAAAALEPEVKPDGLNFLIFGDWGRKGQKDQVEVATQMAISADKIDARFIVSVGDNFYDFGVTSVDDPQWQTSFEQVYSTPSLQVPWQVILGNHDYRGNCDAQIAYGQTHPRWKMPARYYIQSEKIDDAVTADFFYIDTSPMIKIHHAKADTQCLQAGCSQTAGMAQGRAGRFKSAMENRGRSSSDLFRRRTRRHAGAD